MNYINNNNDDESDWKTVQAAQYGGQVSYQDLTAAKLESSDVKHQIMVKSILPSERIKCWTCYKQVVSL